MSSYFKYLIQQSKVLDESIFKLSDTWQQPHLLVGGYMECSEQAITYIEDMKKSLQSVQEDVKDILESTNASTSAVVDMNVLLEESEKEYEEIKSQCDSLYTVLQEYGYHYNNNKTGTEEEKNEESRVTQLNNQNNTQEVEIVISPELSYKRTIRLHDRPMSVSTRTLENKNLYYEETPKTSNHYY